MQDLASKLDIWVYLIQQAPVIVVLSTACYLLLKKIDAKDVVIKGKDEQMSNERKEVLALYGKAVAAQERGNEIQIQLITVIKELQQDVDKLRDAVHDK